MIGMSKEPILSSSASRARRYRQRRRDGDVVVQVEVSAPAIAGLVDCGLLDADDVTRSEISLALKSLLDAVEGEATEFDAVAWLASQ